MTLSEATDLLEALAARRPKIPGRIALDLDGPVAVLTIDNAAARNSITPSMMVDLAHAVEQLGSWAGAALIVDAAPGPAFCAGGHLGEVLATVDDAASARQMARAMGAVLDELLALPVVSVCAIEGLAIGGGAEIATATDLRAMGPRGALHFVHGALGISPGWGGTRRLVRHLGRRPALEVLLAAERIGAPRAVELGLASIVGEGGAAAAARELLAPALALAPGVARALKRQVCAAEAGDVHADAEAFAGVWGGPVHRAALAKVRGRR